MRDLEDDGERVVVCDVVRDLLGLLEPVEDAVPLPEGVATADRLWDSVGEVDIEGLAV